MSSDWTLIDNPDYADRQPRLLQPACHDRTPMLDIHCECAATTHIHESGIKQAPKDVEIRARCNSCKKLLTFPPGYLHNAFAEMRKRGWIA